MKRKIIAVLLTALLLLTAAACGGQTAPPAPSGALPPAAYQIGAGDTVFRFEVIDAEGVLTAWDVYTDEETVGAALLAVGLIAGDMTAFGLMVTTVNGVTADFDADGAFWAFYVDGDFAMAGVDATDIEPGVTYAFVYTRG